MRKVSPSHMEARVWYSTHKQMRQDLGLVRNYSNSYADIKNKKQSTADCHMKVSICTLPTVQNTSVWAETEAQQVYVYIHGVTTGISISLDFSCCFSMAYCQ